MAITGVATEQYDAREHSYAEDGSLTGTRAWSVDLNLSAATGPELADVDTAAAAIVPVARYDVYPGRPGLLARTFSVKNDGATHSWVVTVGYSSRFETVEAKASDLAADGFDNSTSGPGAGDMSQNAEDRPFTIRSVKRTRNRVLEFDAITEGRVENTAGDPFDPPPEWEETLLGYQISWRVAPANLRWTAVTPPLGRPDYLDTVNSAAFRIWGRTHAARTLRVADVTASMVWDRVSVSSVSTLQLAFELSVELLHKPGGWKRELLNRGRREFIDADEPLRWILDAAGQPVADPVPLHATGRRLLPGEALNYITAWEYPEKNLVELFQ
jgi:hypothetical protein